MWLYVTELSPLFRNTNFGFHNIGIFEKVKNCLHKQLYMFKSIRHGIVLIVEQNTLIYFKKRQLML